MSAKIMDGRVVAQRVNDRLKEEVRRIKERYGQAPKLAVVLVGDDLAASVYVRQKTTLSEELGIEAPAIDLPSGIDEKRLLGVIGDLNSDPTVHAILIQLPLPPAIDEQRVIAAIDPEKDADGFHPLNIGRLQLGRTEWAPCTPAGVMELLDSEDFSLEGKEAVIVGRSNIVGKPMAALLLSRNMTVTVCHSRTRDLAAVCKRADLLVAAVGRPWMLDRSYIREGAIVVDVGINSVTPETAPEPLRHPSHPLSGRLRRRGSVLIGDVRGDHARKVASYYTPVPGGVGPMTVTMLMANTVRLARERLEG